MFSVVKVEVFQNKQQTLSLQGNKSRINLQTCWAAMWLVLSEVIIVRIQKNQTQVQFNPCLGQGDSSTRTTALPHDLHGKGILHHFRQTVTYQNPQQSQHRHEFSFSCDPTWHCKINLNISQEVSSHTIDTWSYLTPQWNFMKMLVSYLFQIISSKASQQNDPMPKVTSNPWSRLWHK